MKKEFKGEQKFKIHYLLDTKGKSKWEIFTLPEKLDGYGYLDVVDWAMKNIPNIAKFCGCEVVLPNMKPESSLEFYNPPVIEKSLLQRIRENDELKENEDGVLTIGNSEITLSDFFKRLAQGEEIIEIFEFIDENIVVCEKVLLIISELFSTKLGETYLKF